MNHNLITIIQKDHYSTNVAHYAADSTPTATLLLLHGMAEHYERYHEFIQFLTKNQIEVYTYSHRGHGLTCPQEELGYFADKNGDELVISDAITILSYIRKNNNNLPLYLMGHSMGSIITRNVIQRYHNLDGVLICGTSNPAPIKSIFGLFYMNLIGYKRRLKKSSPHMDKMLFGSSAYKKLCKSTSYDWLCSNKKEVMKYIEDPFCGFLCTNSFYYDLIKLTLKAAKKTNMYKVNKELPMFIFSGEDDPVGGYGKDVNRLAQFYTSNGYNVTTSLYPKCRHEILLDIQKQNVMNDILDFITTTMTEPSTYKRRD